MVCDFSLTREKKIKRRAGSGYFPSQKFRFLRMYSRHLEGTANSSKMAFPGQTDSH